MYARLLQAACALLVLQCPPAQSQEVPILPEPGSIPEKAKSVGRERMLLSAGGASITAIPQSLTVDGSSLELVAVVETQDPNLACRYITAQVLDVPNSYARFAVAGEQIVGTIVTPVATYRVLPAAAGEISVHRLPSTAGSNAKFTPIAPAANSRVHALERRHLQMERLAHVQPKRAWLNESGRYFKVEGGQLGKLLGTPSAAAVKQLLLAMPELTYAPASLSVQVGKIAQHSGGVIVEFHQTINGIPVFGSNQLATDTHGNVSELTTQLVDPALAGEAAVMIVAEARKAAIRQIESASAQRATRYEELRPSTLLYEREGAGPQRLVAYYTFYLRGLPDGVPVAVHVNAHSAEARMLGN